MSADPEAGLFAVHVLQNGEPSLCAETPVELDDPVAQLIDPSAMKDANSMTFVLLLPGPFQLQLTSMCKEPMMCRVEVNGVVSKTTVRLPPLSTAVIPALRFATGQHGAPLEFPGFRSYMHTFAGLNATDRQRLQCIHLRVAFFDVEITRATWNPKSPEPLAVVPLQLGPFDALFRCLGIDPDSVPQALHEAAAESRHSPPPSNDGADVSAPSSAADDYAASEPAPVAPEAPPNVSRAGNTGSSTTAAAPAEGIHVLLAERVKLLAEVEHWKRRCQELERTIARDRHANKSYERLASTNSRTSSRDAGSRTSSKEPAPRSKALAPTATAPTRTTSASGRPQQSTAGPPPSTATKGAAAPAVTATAKPKPVLVRAAAAPAVHPMEVPSKPLAQPAPVTKSEPPPGRKSQPVPPPAVIEDAPPAVYVDPFQPSNSEPTYYVGPAGSRPRTEPGDRGHRLPQPMAWVEF